MRHCSSIFLRSPCVPPPHNKSSFLHVCCDWSSTGIPAQIQGKVADRNVPGPWKCSYEDGTPQILVMRMH